MNKIISIAGSILMTAGGIVTYLASTMIQPEQAIQSPLVWILLGAGGVLLILGVALSLSELVKSIAKRLKAAREREKTNRDRQRQARRNRENSASG